VEANARDLEFAIPWELEGGVYANALAVWHSPHEFTLDFGVMRAAEPATDIDPTSDISYRVVARIRFRSRSCSRSFAR
jgi:hypothetical protein